MSGYEFEIESGVPQPVEREGMNRKYPWAGMKVGDSFLIPNTEASAIVRGGYGGLYSSARYFGATRAVPGFRIAVRKSKEGLRVWRIA